MILANLLFKKSPKSYFLFRSKAPLIIKKIGTPILPMSWKVIWAIICDCVVSGPKKVNMTDENGYYCKCP